MSKEFECLDRIDKRNYLTEREHKEFLGVVEKVLTEYEAIKNAEPTKAMECLEKLSKSMPQYDSWIKYIDTIKQALLKAEQGKKKARCWDIVVKKNVNVGWFKAVLETKGDSYACYLFWVNYTAQPPLTEEEFNLLKGILNDEQ